MATFKAIVIDKAEAGQTVRLADFDDKDLMDGDVTVRVEWSTLNYKDGLAVTGKAPVVRRFPMIGGVDFSGTVESSSHPAWKPGDKVILNGWGLGETHLGAYAGKARVRGDWLVRLPANMSARDAMAIGTAGYTAMLSVLALERGGITPARGAIVVTGAAGGVGSVAVAILAKLGYTVIVSTGRSRLPQRPRCFRNHRPQGACRPGATARKGALGGRHRCGRLDDARECAFYDTVWRSYRRMRSCGRNGLADLGCALHPSRRVLDRYRFGDVSIAVAAGGLAAVGSGLGQGRQARGDDHGDRPRRRHRCRQAHCRRAGARPDCGKDRVKRRAIWPQSWANIEGRRGRYGKGTVKNFC